jgi:hypothetical protein
MGIMLLESFPIFTLKIECVKLMYFIIIILILHYNLQNEAKMISWKYSLYFICILVAYY